MKSVLSQFRKPVKFPCGLLLTILAVAALVVCVGQFSATKLTRANIEDQYDTIGLVSSKYFMAGEAGNMTLSTRLPEDLQAWITETTQDRPDLIKMESETQRTSAYIPGLLEDNFSKYTDGDYLGINQENIGNPYRSAMLEVTLTQVGSSIKRDIQTYEFGDVVLDVCNYASVLCAGTVDGVIGMAEGFTSPVGKNITVAVCASDDQALADLNLQVGKRYLIYGMDYSDTHGQALERKIVNNMDGYEELYGPAAWKYDHYDYTPIMDQVDCFMTTVNVQIPMEANIFAIVTVITAAHIVLTGLVLLLAAVPMTSERRSMKRK